MLSFKRKGKVSGPNRKYIITIKDNQQAYIELIAVYNNNIRIAKRLMINVKKTNVNTKLSENKRYRNALKTPVVVESLHKDKYGL